MFSSEIPFLQRLKYILFFIIIIPLLSCSSSQQTSNFSPPANFDASNYINPEDYGYDLVKPYGDTPKSADSSFVPVDFDALAAQKKMEYPKFARRNGIQGNVKLKVYVDSTGSLKNMEVIESPHKLLTRATKKAAAKTNFTPASLNDKPVNAFSIFSGYFEVRSRSDIRF